MLGLFRRSKPDKSWIQLAGGRQFWPLEARGPLVLSDIAHGLSKLCRYNGAVNTFYSVAQHSINVARQLPRELKLWGLLHDASEFALGDVVRPLKHRWFMFPYRRAESRLMKRVARQFDLPWPMPNEVHEVDRRMYATEVKYLFDEIHPDWQASWLKGLQPYDMPKEAFVSRMNPDHYADEFIGLYNALKWG